MKVGELREKLASFPDDAEVEVWLPGSTIRLGLPFRRGDKVQIEGNINPGSALEGLETPENHLSYIREILEK